MLEPCDGKLSCTVLRGEWGREAPDLPDVRHEVAQFECTQVLTLEYPVCSYRTLRRRATVAQMTGCEALRTMYRIGFKW
jgi:hypothetical protein